MRRCVGCRRSLPKGELLRLVRGDGEVRVDRAGVAEGRGAYVCNRRECADSLAAGRPLARAFRAPVTVKQETIESVREWQRSASTR
ncbi:MAG: YlxR family protein [Thermoleophilaceae bacterium]|nr:YlxR family protein [Thermoleophilaceae bacterium]